METPPRGIGGTVRDLLSRFLTSEALPLTTI